MSKQYFQTTEFSQVNSEIISESNLTNVINSFKVDECLQKAAIIKRNGLNPLCVFTVLFKLILVRARSIYEGLRLIHKDNIKSIVNSFLNDPWYDWRKLLSQIAKLFFKKFKPDVGETTVFILDDTPKVKSGKFVEFIAKFKDTSKCVTYKGYQILLGVLSNNRTAVPIDFAIKIGDKRTPDSKEGNYPMESHISQRLEEAKKSKISISIDMIKRALENGFKFAYVLWDSAFNSSKSYQYVFNTLVPKGIHLITRVKLDDRRYKIEENEFRIEQLIELAGEWKEICDSKIFSKSIEVEVIDSDVKDRPTIGTVKLCFYKFNELVSKRQNKRKYKNKPNLDGCIAIISTNTELSEEKNLEIYTKRWGIEVINRDLKQHFGLYQSMSSKYAPQVADLTLKCIFYLMICSLKERSSNKSPYQILFEFVKELEKHNLYVLTKEMFLDLLKQMADIGVIEIKIDYQLLVDIIDKFLYNEFFPDNVLEIDNDI